PSAQTRLRDWASRLGEALPGADKEPGRQERPHLCRMVPCGEGEQPARHKRTQKCCRSPSCRSRQSQLRYTGERCGQRLFLKLAIPSPTIPGRDRVTLL